MRTRVIVLTAAIAALTLGGCSSSGTKTTGTSSSGATTGSSSSTGNAATGSTITLGLINLEDATVGSDPELRDGIELGIKYVNDQLGGWKGHKLALKFCKIDGSAGSTANCGAQMVAAKVPLVLDGVDGAAGSAIPALAKAGIPIISEVPTSLASYASPNSFDLAGGGVANTPGIATYIAGVLKAKTVDALVVNQPQALQAVTGSAGAVFKATGVKLKVIPVDGTTPDYSSAWAQAAADKPDFIMTVFSADSCVRLMQGRAAAGVTIPSSYTDTCTGSKILKTAGSAANDMYSTSTTLLPTSSDPNVVTYVNAVKKYSNPSTEGGYQQLGFSQLLNTYKVISTIPGTDLTAAAAMAAFKAAKNVPGFMSHEFSCDGTLIPTLTSVCNNSIRIVQVKNGTLTDIGNGWLPKG